jgi:hypothetical protein
VWLKDFLLEFDDVVNPSKAVPPLYSTDIFPSYQNDGAAHHFLRPQAGRREVGGSQE